jgi:hypothetical protein
MKRGDEDIGNGHRCGGAFGDERDRPVQSILPTIIIPFTTLSQCSMSGADSITRITTSFRTAIVSENECTILSEIFQVECRHSSFAINSSIVAPLTKHAKFHDAGGGLQT